MHLLPLLVLLFSLYLPWLSATPPGPRTTFCMVAECPPVTAFDADTATPAPVLWLPIISR